MDITFFLGGLSGGGAERVVCNLANFFAGHSHNVDIITIGDDDSFGLDQRVCRVTLLRKEERKGVVGLLKRIIRLLRYLRKKRDVFIVMLPLSTILLLRLKRFVKGKIIVSERSFPTNYPVKHQLALKRLAHRADAWVFQTEESQQWYQPFLDDAIPLIIPNPINGSFKNLFYTGERNHQIITAGRLNRVKNHALLIESFSKVLSVFPDVNLVIYGKGALLEELKEIADSFGVGEKVSFPGFVPWEEESRKAALFVLSSDLEGMPNALIEAMSMGLPCVSTDCKGGGARFLIQNGVNGLLVPPGNVDALADAMISMLSDKDLAKSCGEKAHLVIDRLDPERIYGQWDRLLQNIVAAE